MKDNLKKRERKGEREGEEMNHSSQNIIFGFRNGETEVQEVKMSDSILH